MSAASAQPTVEGSKRAPVTLDKQDESLPLLVEPINDFATLIDEPNRLALDRMVKALQSATGDAIVVVTVPTFAPYGSIQDYANKLYDESRARNWPARPKTTACSWWWRSREPAPGVGRGRLRPSGIITDGFAGETSRMHAASSSRASPAGA